VPALVVSPFARKGTVDHTVYDTGSILRLITRVFDLETLDGLKRRDEAMRARGQTPMGDLTAALHLGAQRGALLADLSAYMAWSALQQRPRSSPSRG
jgi:phospholipase C